MRNLPIPIVYLLATITSHTLAPDLKIITQDDKSLFLRPLLSVREILLDMAPEDSRESTRSANRLREDGCVSLYSGMLKFIVSFNASIRMIAITAVSIRLDKTSGICI